MNNSLFITGIGTGVGKTVCAAVLAGYLDADYWKPVQAGDLDCTDTVTVKKLLGSHVVAHRECYRFRLAASPHQAAAAEGVVIDMSAIVPPVTDKVLVIEGAGGLMVPLNERNCMIDLIQQLQAPVALVTRNYLGCINHTLLSIHAILARGLQLQYLVLNGSFHPDTERAIVKALPDATKLIRIPSIMSVSRQAIQRTVQQLRNDLQHL